MGSLTGAYIQVWFAVFLVIPPLPSSSITLVSVPIFFPLSTDTPMYVCIAHLDLNLLGFVPRTLSTTFHPLSFIHEKEGRVFCPIIPYAVLRYRFPAIQLDGFFLCGQVRVKSSFFSRASASSCPWRRRYHLLQRPLRPRNAHFLYRRESLTSVIMGVFPCFQLSSYAATLLEGRISPNLRLQSSH